MQRGGVTLGQGGFGSVVTSDELTHMVGPHEMVVMLVVELGTGTVRESPVTDVKLLLRQLRDKIVLKITDDDNELSGNLSLLSRLAARMKHNKVSATVIDRTSPFFLHNGRKHFVAGFLIGTPAAQGAQYTLANVRMSIPVYRRMLGDLMDFYDRFGEVVTAQHVLDITMSTLYMLREMAAVRAHHVDIKEPNILYDIQCPTESSHRQVTAGHLRRLGGCQVRFALSDFGLIMLDPRRDTPTDSGTPGFMSPLMYERYDDFHNDYLSPMWHTAPGSPKDVWQSYEMVHSQTRVRTPAAKSGIRTGVTRGRQQLMPKLSGAQRFEKNDLYALGVMLMYFDYSQDERTRPINDLGVALVMGPAFRGSIMTVDHAIEAYRKVRAALSSSERRLDLRTLRHLNNNSAGYSYFTP